MRVAYIFRPAQTGCAFLRRHGTARPSHDLIKYYLRIASVARAQRFLNDRRLATAKYARRERERESVADVHQKREVVEVKIEKKKQKTKNCEEI